jgi:hypothetical protein
MTEVKSVSWNEATKSGKFVTLEEDEQKTLVITKWKLEEVEKFGEMQIEFTSEVLSEDGVTATDEKLFTTVSNRLKKKLRVVLEDRQPTEQVAITIMKIGSKFNTNYSLKEVKPLAPAPVDEITAKLKETEKALEDAEPVRQ